MSMRPEVELSKPIVVPLAALLIASVCVVALTGVCLWQDDRRIKSDARIHELQGDLKIMTLDRDRWFTVRPICPPRDITMSTNTTLAKECGVPGVSANPGLTTVIFPFGCRIDVATVCR